MKTLEKQVAVVTGGNAGIGQAIVKKFVQEGATVAIFGTNAKVGQAVIDDLMSEYPESHLCFYTVNVADTSAVQKAIEEVITAFGKIDILVNNAGITADQLLMKMSEEEWDRVLDVNLKSCFNTSKAVIRQMMKAKKGRIINIASVVGLMGNAGQVNYAASKAGMIGFTKALAKEVAPRNILVNCIAPGFIKTKMTETLTEAQQADVLPQIPLRRMGNVEEVAHLVSFLASDHASYITGQTFAVDGGMTMH